MFGIPLAEIFSVFLGVLQFPKEFSAMWKLLQGTSSEEKVKIIGAAQAESDRLAKEGRPSWD